MADPWVPIRLQPGLWRNGTEYQAKGRYYEQNLCRFFMGMLRPVGGWSQLGASSLDGKARAIHTWTDLSSVSRAVVGSEQGLWLYTTTGTLTDITPAGWADTDADSSVWSIDNGGQQLFAVNDEDTEILTWLPGDTDASALANAPSAVALHVTNEGILFALGADGDPRLIAWSDARDFDDWTPAVTNFAGDKILEEAGALQCATKVRGGSLVLTTEGAHFARYVGQPDVYNISFLRKDCGAISRNCLINTGSRGWWMGRDNFYMWNGYIEPIPCDIHDAIFGGGDDALNLDQAQKVNVWHNSEFNEIWWHYPSGTECDRVAVFNYAEGHWNLHTGLSRLCGVGKGDGFPNPLLVASDGAVYEHETGTSHTGGGTIYARTGPLEAGSGRERGRIMRFIPDEDAAGDVSMYVHTRDFPNGTETTQGPFTGDLTIDCIVSARQFALEWRQAEATDWRVGEYRAEIQKRGKW